jgi:hypothetical protein
MIHTGSMRRVFVLLALLLLANALWCVAACSANEFAPDPPCHHREASAPCAHIGFSAVLSSVPLIALESATPIEGGLIQPEHATFSIISIDRFSPPDIFVPSFAILRI